MPISAVIGPDIKRLQKRQVKHVDIHEIEGGRGCQDWHGDCGSSLDEMSPDAAKEDQMHAKLVKLLLPRAAIGAIATGPASLAQAPAPPPAPPVVAPPPAPPAASYYSNQLPETPGTVRRFTLTPIGELDGVILTDGTEIHLPPHLTTRLARPRRAISANVDCPAGLPIPWLPLQCLDSLLDHREHFGMRRTAAHTQLFRGGPNDGGNMPGRW
ncbi:MAG: hypothetical protein WBF43_05930 [Methylocella sp.]